ncbi:leucine-rich repeat and immunoglobulin-like domain-containing nogo receptor-interacting protein 3 [Octopus bimaculoides]|uniref:leucine-rich repeat and immunoglobulin-like domain-containing nogo receptor-interacting protein 3 n=1 Tax=Octopus bimaculoides TaxID=37653 RepID=UPI00071D53E4|nr:leucine-rich repeat and immunoglobulin-like domain-containing nogo receptor-interacting protein 3 [Octopus bimaculoides]|eukprot:XP_014778260.1 PREDICTED: leucine-rich repeat and immunoglobulin-like domain-containing nogo receptor-interacting protein 3 [Octopus bimaculoides]
MLRQSMHLKLTFVLVLYIRLLFEVGAFTDICSQCRCGFTLVNCQKNRFNSLPNATIMRVFKYLELGENNITNIDIGIMQTFNHLKRLNLSYNKIQTLKKGFFQGLTVLEELNLGHNEITTIEEGSFENLFRLKKLYLNGNALQYISSRIFQYLLSLTVINLSRNQIQKIEDGTFLFLPKITEIDLTRNIGMECGCHLPVLVNYTEKAFNRRLVVLGACNTSVENSREGFRFWKILKYSQCQNYSLFQRGLQCQSCEGTICNDSDVTICSGNESVCMTNVSTTGFTRKVVRSCRAYNECMGTMANKFKTCRVWVGNIDCASCCSGNSCNKHLFVAFSA